MRDFNRYSLLWGCSYTNVKGKIVENIVGKYYLCIQLFGAYTLSVHKSSGQLSLSLGDKIDVYHNSRLSDRDYIPQLIQMKDITEGGTFIKAN